jgi:hypothetical protein
MSDGESSEVQLKQQPKKKKVTKKAVITKKSQPVPVAPVKKSDLDDDFQVIIDEDQHDDMEVITGVNDPNDLNSIGIELSSSSSISTGSSNTQTQVDNDLYDPFVPSNTTTKNNTATTNTSSYAEKSAPAKKSVFTIKPAEGERKTEPNYTAKIFEDSMRDTQSKRGLSNTTAKPTPPQPQSNKVAPPSARQSTHQPAEHKKPDSALKIFYCCDHNTRSAPGPATIIVANDEKHAIQLLDAKLKVMGFKTYSEKSYNVIEIPRVRCVVLLKGSTVRRPSIRELSGKKVAPSSLFLYVCKDHYSQMPIPAASVVFETNEESAKSALRDALQLEDTDNDASSRGASLAKVGFTMTRMDISKPKVEVLTTGGPR